MTGADPAVEAARRAWGAGADWEFNDKDHGRHESRRRP